MLQDFTWCITFLTDSLFLLSTSLVYEEPTIRVAERKSDSFFLLCCSLFPPRFSHLQSLRLHLHLPSRSLSFRGPEQLKLGWTSLLFCYLEPEDSDRGQWSCCPPLTALPLFSLQPLCLLHSLPRSFWRKAGLFWLTIYYDLLLFSCSYFLKVFLIFIIVFSFPTGFIWCWNMCFSDFCSWEFPI